MCVYRFYFKSLSTAPCKLPSCPWLQSAWAPREDTAVQRGCLSRPPGETHSQGLLCRAVSSGQPHLQEQPGLSRRVLLQDESTAEITFYMKGADVAMASIVQYNDWLEEEVCTHWHLQVLHAAQGVSCGYSLGSLDEPRFQFQPDISQPIEQKRWKSW